jgi:hypothetical protein
MQGTISYPFNMNKLYIICLISLWVQLIIQVDLGAQGTDFFWARKAGGPGSDEGADLTVDGSGNIYVTGSFEDSALFENTLLRGYGKNDVFLAKYDKSGKILWVQQAGGSGFDEGKSLGVDRSGNIYVTGYFSKTATFGPFTLIASSDDWELFIAKYDPSGKIQWAHNAGGISHVDALDLAVDNSGNAFITGAFHEISSFGNTKLISSGDDDIFLAKYNAKGKLQWARQAGGKSEDRATGISVDRFGNIYLTGYFWENLILDHVSLTGGITGDVFVAKYDAQGRLKWAKQAGGGIYQTGSGIATDRAGNAYLTGQLQGTITFDTETLTILI